MVLREDAKTFVNLFDSVIDIEPIIAFQRAMMTDGCSKESFCA
jgi:hypothetical protein